MSIKQTCSFSFGDFSLFDRLMHKISITDTCLSFSIMRCLQTKFNDCFLMLIFRRKYESGLLWAKGTRNTEALVSEFRENLAKARLRAGKISFT